MNSTKTAFCSFSLEANAFSKYRLTGPYANLPVTSGVKAKLYIKVSVIYKGCLSAEKCKRLTDWLYIMQSVLSVLGKGTLSQNVESLELQIKDPGTSLRKRRRKKESSQRIIRDGDQDSDEEENSESLQARLILKLVCKHGELIKPVSCR